jgi:uncharacterized protein (UPF0332 family)
MSEQEPLYMAKAVESLEGAASEYTNRRYQNSANRSYYACFQAAVHALISAGFTPPTDTIAWSHKGLQAIFANQLIQRRKLYPSELRSVLPVNYTLREAADYSDDLVSAVQADRALRRAKSFVAAVQERRGTQT